VVNLLVKKKPPRLDCDSFPLCHPGGAIQSITIELFIPRLMLHFLGEKDVPWFLKKLDPKKRSPKASSKRKGTSQISFEVLQKKRFQIDEISRFTLPLKLL